MNTGSTVGAPSDGTIHGRPSVDSDTKNHSSDEHEQADKESVDNEEDEMSSNEEQERGAARNTLSVMARAGVHGAKVATAAAANKELVDLVEELCGEHYPDLMRTAMGRPFAELVTPLVLLQLSHMFPERFPRAHLVQAGCEYALEAVSRDSLEPLLRMVVPLSGKLAKVGAQYMSDSVSKAKASRTPTIEQLEDDEETEAEIRALRERVKANRSASEA
jgi:hypothetical protein